ncbi:uncharacterized protein ATC70_005276 [Mucor velutinosus]|uniref:Uncharacterized protein n=1 Tax=Mucor velutinosus TaxID=708070 RepID=A0AAN7D4T6_9FUNG|nr:hypothetical protein ATC70_005276 [Mucor velutinosus]
MQTSTGDPINQHEFIDLMNGCPHLAEIVFTDVNPFYYIHSLCRQHNVKLPQLELIRIGSRSANHMLDHDYVNLACKYRATLNQLCVHVATSDIIHLDLSSTANYLRRFPRLKCLSLDTSCPIVFDADIRACPQLQVLCLRMHSSISFKVMSDEQNDTLTALNPASQLETLKVDDLLLSQQLYRYLKHRCTLLSHLVVNLSSDADFGPLIHTFGAFEDTQALTITNISFDNYTPQAN